MPRHKATRDVGATEKAFSNLTCSGQHMLGQLLTADQCKELFAYFEHRTVWYPYAKGFAHRFPPLSDSRPAWAHIAHHDPEDVLDAPYLLDLANDPRILDVVGRFLGCKPTIGYMATWWSYATGVGAQQAEKFHRDFDDWRFVKLFVYLTDVTPENGPHTYVLHSSCENKLTEIRRFTNSEVSLAFGEENIRTMTASAGVGFLEDTYGVHKGEPLKSGHRLIFQVVYSLVSLPYAPRRPVTAMSAGFKHDMWVNRLYLK